ncbi:MAG: O-antigen ligase family protein [Candidatus Kerfeldbacteria bacterium]
MIIKNITIYQPGRPRDLAIIATIFWLGGIGALAFINPLYMVFAVLGTAAVLVFGARPVAALYAMAASYPFIQLEIVYGAFNAPIVDVIAILALAAWAFRILWFLMVDRERLKELRFPLVWFYAAWVIIAALSLINTWDIALSFKYLLRPLAFFYLAYVFVTVNTILNTKTLWRVLFVLYIVGIAVALYGLYGFLTVDVNSFLDRRVVPLPIFGMNPLGGNQNIIADVMVTTIPIGFFLMLHIRGTKRQKMLFLGLLLLIGVNLMTFSRSGWLALIVMLGTLLVLQYRHFLKNIARYTVIACIVALPLFGYMFLFSTQEQVQSSNVNRLMLNDIALEMVTEYPLLGQGAGTFVTRVESNPLYIREFGAPLDAHGFIQKVAGELGLLGLAAYLAFIGAVLWFIYKEYRRHDRADNWSYLLASLLVMVVGTVFFQLFQTSYFVAKLWFPVGVAIAAVYLARRNTKLDMSGV